MEHIELNIPLSLTKHILSEKKVPQFRVWLALKAVYGSHVQYEEIDKRKVADLCGFKKEQTVDYHLEKLLDWNWVGDNNGLYFLRPLSYLCHIYKVRGGKVHKIDLTTQLPNLAELLFSMCLAYIINFRKYVGRKLGRYEQAIIEGYKMQEYKATTLSVRLIAKLLNLSANMVHRLKIAAIDIGYLDRTKHNRMLFDYQVAYMLEKYPQQVYCKDGAWRANLTDNLFPRINTKISKHYNK